MFNFFQAYASGCNIVILSPKFERVQIIPGVCHDNIQISCLDCSVDSGKIAAAYANQIIVFEPTPLLAACADGDNQDGGVPRSGLDYWWVETSRVKAESRVASLAWNNEGNRLLTAGDYIQMWQFKQQAPGIEGITINSLPADGSSATSGAWTCTWKVRPPNPVHFLAYSPDGTLFATAGANDRLVRIWYENQQSKCHLFVSSASPTTGF